MKLYATDCERDFTPVVTDLPGGMTITWPAHLDGGATVHAQDFMAALATAGRRRYRHAYEWCAGMGLIGFEALARGYCHRLTFSDYYDVAIDSCTSNAAANGIADRVHAHVSSTIAGLPSGEPFDLVLANPPHSPEEWHLTQFWQDTHNPLLQNSLRLTIDQDYEIHREFFANIAARLSPSADLFISEVGEERVFIDMAAQGGLQHVFSHAHPHLPYGKIMQYRYEP